MFQQALQGSGALWVKGKGILFGHVVHLRQLQLDRMLLLVRLSISASDIPTLEAAVKHVGELLLLFTTGNQTVAQRRGATFATVGTQIEIRQFTVE
ncbi:hypothetical protein D3C73_1451120 [compost metagenome]